jgi:hypothetical protein
MVSGVSLCCFFFFSFKRSLVTYYTVESYKESSSLMGREKSTLQDIRIFYNFQELEEQ